MPNDKSQNGAVPGKPVGDGLLVYGTLFLWSTWPAAHYISNNIHLDLEPIYIAITSIAYFLAVSGAYTVARRVHTPRIYPLAGVFAVGSFYFFGIQIVRSTLHHLNLDISISITWFITFVGVGVVSWWLIRTRKAFFLLTACAAVGYSTAIGGAIPKIYDISRNRAPVVSAPEFSAIEKSLPSDRLRNVYYIVLDSYLRNDKIAEYLDYDNSDFTRFLEARGFMIPRFSRSNYEGTARTMSSTLAMQYIDPDLHRSRGFRRHGLKVMLGRNPVYDMFHNLDYTIVVNYAWYCSSAVDRCLTVSVGLPDDVFEFLRLSPLPVLLSYVSADLYRSLSHRWSILLDQASERMRNVIGERLFVILHFLELHDMIYDADCSINPWIGTMDLKRMNFPDRKLKEKRFYRTSLNCVNIRIQKLIDEILERDKESIIVITGDHGTLFSETEDRKSDPEEVHGTFSAWRLPDLCDGIVYDTITNINHFRALRACLTGEEPKFIEDVMWVGNPEVGDRLYSRTIPKFKAAPQN